MLLSYVNLGKTWTNHCSLIPWWVGIETSNATNNWLKCSTMSATYISNSHLLKVHWYKQPRHYLTRWCCQLAFRQGSPQCFQMDLQAITLSSLEQVQIFRLCSILLQCATFPHCLSSGCKGLTSQVVHVCKGFNTESLKSTSVLFPDPICFWMKPSWRGSSSWLQTTLRSQMSMANLKTVMRKCYRN